MIEVEISIPFLNGLGNCAIPAGSVILENRGMTHNSDGTGFLNLLIRCPVPEVAIGTGN